MNDTPRTDAEVFLLFKTGDDEGVPAEFARKLERENAALRNEVARLNNQTNWVCSCGGTDCAGQKENAALRADKERLDWLETNGREQVYGPTWRIAWQFGQDVSLRAVIDAARKEAQP